MSPEALEALKKSIEKWEKNAVAEKAEDAKTNASDCPLCDLYFRNFCHGCPIAAATKKMCCGGTPYEHAFIEKEYWLEPGSDGTAFRAAARAEVDFLKSLLPEEGRS